MLLIPMLVCSVDLLVINSLSQDLISVIATRTVCLGYSAAANQRQHCDGTGGPFNQQKLKGKGGALPHLVYRSSPSIALIRFTAQRWSTACSTPVSGRHPLLLPHMDSATMLPCEWGDR